MRPIGGTVKTAGTKGECSRTSLPHPVPARLHCGHCPVQALQSAKRLSVGPPSGAVLKASQGSVDAEGAAIQQTYASVAGTGRARTGVAGRTLTFIAQPSAHQTLCASFGAWHFDPRPAPWRPLPPPCDAHLPRTKSRGRVPATNRRASLSTPSPQSVRRVPTHFIELQRRKQKA